MKKIFVLAGILFSIVAVSQDKLVVDPNAEMRTIYGGYTSIKVSGGIDLYLSQSGTEAIAVSAADNKYKSGIKTVVENNVLNIFYEGDRNWNLRNKQMKAYVSFKALELLDASGACDIIVAGQIIAGELTMKLSGASYFKGAVAVNTLHMELSGASDVRINGTASILTIQSSGASDVDGYGLVTDMCEANASGASDINITVNKELTARASGASEILYRGLAFLKDVQKSGASSVERSVSKNDL